MLRLVGKVVVALCGVVLLTSCGAPPPQGGVTIQVVTPPSPRPVVVTQPRPPAAVTVVRRASFPVRVDIPAVGYHSTVGVVDVHDGGVEPPKDQPRIMAVARGIGAFPGSVGTGVTFLYCHTSPNGSRYGEVPCNRLDTRAGRRGVRHGDRVTVAVPHGHLHYRVSAIRHVPKKDVPKKTDLWRRGNKLVIFTCLQAADGVRRPTTDAIVVVADFMSATP